MAKDRGDGMSQGVLPAQFADLEPFVADWSLAEERARNHKRLSSSMEELRTFYDAIFPRMETNPRVSAAVSPRRYVRGRKTLILSDIILGRDRTGRGIVWAAGSDRRLRIHPIRARTRTQVLTHSRQEKTARHSATIKSNTKCSQGGSNLPTRGERPPLRYNRNS